VRKTFFCLITTFLLLTTSSTAGTSSAISNCDIVPASLLSSLGIVRGACDKHIGLSEFRLKSNGLTILLQERHSTPVLTVMVVYHVGSRNEAVGYTGATHFLEHMMFKGSDHYDPLKGKGLEDLLKPTGGINNASTWFDRTNYFEVVPSSCLPLCLDFEADRMRHLRLRQSDRNSEMTVVRNEMERNRNDARTLLETQLFATAYREHPYHHPAIGWQSDVENVPLSRLKQFYDEFYWPNNATTVLVGDFNSQDALRQIVAKFGKIPHSPHPIPTVYTKEPPQEGERRFTVQRGAELPRVEIAFHTCAASNPDIYPLAVIESVLGDNNKQSSRLYKAVIDTGLASEAYAYSYELHDPGLFVVSAAATSGTKLAKIENALADQIHELKTKPLFEVELKRAQTAVSKKLLLSGIDPSDFAELLTESIAASNWQYLVTYPQHIQAVTTQDVLRVANKYFNEHNETVGYYLPKEKLSKEEIEQQLQAPELPGPSTVAHLKPQPKSSASHGYVHSPTHGSISAQVVSKTFDNGLRVDVLPVKGIGAVSVDGKILAGDYFGTADKSLLPSVTAEMLTKGSSNYSREQLADELENMGTSLSFGSNSFWVEFNSDVVTEDLPRFLSLLADTLRNPAFPIDELKKNKKIFESAIKQHMSDTHETARNALAQHLYKPGCVYYEKPFSEQLHEISTISAEELHDFHSSHYGPSNIKLAIVGDVDPQTVFKLIETQFSDWHDSPTTTVHKVTSPEVQPPATSSKVVVNLSDKENVDITIGRPVDMSLKSPDYYAALLGNAALGYSPFSTRLSPVREQYGYCYSIYSTFIDTSYGGAPWVIECTVNPGNTNKTCSLIDSLVAKYLKTGIGAQELALESGHIAGEFLVDLRAPSEIARYLTRFEMLGLGPQFFDEFPRRLHQVTKPQVDAAIRKYFDLNHAVTVTSGTF
jgi:zinc protease